METRNCQVCGSVMTFIQAGVSQRTGKAYNAFYACPNKCQQTRPQQQAPVRSPQIPQDPNYIPNTGNQILAAELQSLKTEAKDYFKQLNDQQTFLLTRITEVENIVKSLDTKIVNEIFPDGK